MARPIISARYATDPAYLSGPDTGLAPRLTVGAAERAQGVIGGDRFAARKFNDLVGNQGDWIDHLDGLAAHGAMQTWDMQVLPFSAGGRDCEFPFLSAVKLPSRNERAIVAQGWDNNDSDRLVFLRSLGAGFFESSPNGAGTTGGPFSASGGAEGEFLCTNSPDMVAHTSLVTKATSGLGSASILYYCAFSATPYVAITGGGAQYRGATMAGIAPAVVGYTITAGTNSTLGVPAGEFCDDGSANLILAYKGTVSGVTAYRIFHSTNGGANWTIAKTYDPAITNVKLCWCTANGSVAARFVAIASDGNVSTSNNGLSWSAGTTIAGLSVASGASARHGTLASVRGVMAMAWSPALYAYGSAGLVYSLDGGITWFKKHVSDADFASGTGLKSIIGANGRFYATDNLRVYRSGLFEFNAADIT